MYDFVRTKNENILKNQFLNINYLSLICTTNFFDCFKFNLQNKIFKKLFCRHCISFYSFPAGYQNRNILQFRLGEKTRAKMLIHILNRTCL